MGRFSKHLGKGTKIVIEDEEYELKPLGTEYIPHFFKAMKCFSGAQGKDSKPEDTFKNMDDAGLNSIKTIIEATLTKSFPDEPKEERDAFGLKYMSILMNTIFEMNSADAGSIEKIKKMKHLKTAQQNVESKTK